MHARTMDSGVGAPAVMAMTFTPKSQEAWTSSALLIKIILYPLRKKCGE